MKLIFVYNATSGGVNSILDSVRKLWKPKVHECALCSLTFGVFSEKRYWKSFRKTSGIEMVFLHKDEFLKQYKSKWLPKYDFPLILSQEDQALHIFMANTDIASIDTVEALVSAIESRV
tara:strand:- start:18117 stop:18473 length:357 start_codon:yes stop_codon:yes gene_type:complete